MGYELTSIPKNGTLKGEKLEKRPIDRAVSLKERIDTA